MMDTSARTHCMPSACRQHPSNSSAPVSSHWRRSCQQDPLFSPCTRPIFGWKRFAFKSGSHLNQGHNTKIHYATCRWLNFSEIKQSFQYTFQYTFQIHYATFRSYNEFLFISNHHSYNLKHARPFCDMSPKYKPIRISVTCHREILGTKPLENV